MAIEEGTGLLIHDFLTDSRTAICYIAYMLKYLGYKFSDSLRYLISKRPETRIKKKFANQLKEWSENL